MRLIGSVLLAIAFVTACGPESAPLPSGSLRPGERWLPVAYFPPDVLCAGGGFVGEFRLRGSPDDPRVAWLEEPDGSRRELAWPEGYTARFAPALEVLDAAGRVVAVAGDLATGGCPTARDAAWLVDF